MDYLNHLCEKYGSPMYFFNEDYVEERIGYLREKLPENVNICYAMKANTFLTKTAAKYSNRIEVCSPGEYRICKRLGISPEQLVISGVYKDERIMKDILLTDGDKPVYTVESFEQYRILRGLASENNLKINVLIRMTSSNQFGMKLSDIKVLLENWKGNEDFSFVHILGLHYFSGTQKHSLKHIQKELEKVKKAMDELEEVFAISLEELEYGGGFPVTYFQDEEFDEEEFLRGFSEIINSLNIKQKITVELGRSIVAGAGYYHTKIVDTKSDRFVSYCILEGGINHMVYFGQNMGMRVPHVLHRVDGEWKEVDEAATDFVLCGSLCTSNDILVKQMKLTNPKIGDGLVFTKVGAYSMIEGIALFLSRELPGIVLYSKKKQQDCLVRKIIETDELNCPNYNL